MRYTVIQKISTMTGWKLMLRQAGDVNTLPVCQDDFERINVGDTVELLISVIQPEPIAA